MPVYYNNRRRFRHLPTFLPQSAENCATAAFINRVLTPLNQELQIHFFATSIIYSILCLVFFEMASNAEQLAEELSKGELDLGEVAPGGGSGKQRTKLEQAEHKKPHPEGDTRRITKNAMNGTDKRREEEKVKNEKRDRKPS